MNKAERESSREFSQVGIENAFCPLLIKATSD
jgi:hypothetical protein